MEKFIELTTNQGVKVRINIHYIVTYNQYDQKLTRVKLIGENNSIHVIETYYEVTDIINRAK